MNHDYMEGPKFYLHDLRVSGRFYVETRPYGDNNEAKITTLKGKVELHRDDPRSQHAAVGRPMRFQKICDGEVRLDKYVVLKIDSMDGGYYDWNMESLPWITEIKSSMVKEEVPLKYGLAGWVVKAKELEWQPFDIDNGLAFKFENVIYPTHADAMNDVIRSVPKEYDVYTPRGDDSPRVLVYEGDDLVMEFKPEKMYRYKNV